VLPTEKVGRCGNIYNFAGDFYYMDLNNSDLLDLILNTTEDAILVLDEHERHCDKNAQYRGK
jgi:hypothetical protein